MIYPRVAPGVIIKFDRFAITGLTVGLKLEGGVDILEGDMGKVEGDMSKVEGGMGKIEGGMSKLEGEMGKFEGGMGILPMDQARTRFPYYS